MKINRQLVVSYEIVAMTATADTMEKASELIITDMRQVLETYYGLSHIYAGITVWLYANLRVCQLINHTMRMEVRDDVLGKLCSE